MKRRISLYFLLALLLIGYQNPAHAQFWKKLFKKEQPRKRPPAKKPVFKEKESTKPSRRKQEVVYPATQKKDRYRVDVLMPLYLDELVKDNKIQYKGKIPEKASAGIDLYEGIKLAADTLNSFYYDIDVHVHDIADPASSPERLISSGKLNSSDLIIGALQSQQIPAVAAFAKKQQVNFVSALSPSDADVKDNPYFILMQPTLRTHCEWIMQRVKKKYIHKPVLLYRTSLGVAEDAYKYLAAVAEKDVEQVLCNKTPTKQQLAPLFDSSRVNVVIMAFMDHTSVEPLLKQLSDWFPGYSFDIYGMPSWRTMGALRKNDAFPNLAVYVTMPFYFESSTPYSQALINDYKRDMGTTKAGEMVYRGFETMLWYADLLKKHGTIFNEKLPGRPSNTFTKYEVLPRWSDDDKFLYHENANLYLLKYQAGSFMVEQ